MCDKYFDDKRRCIYFVLVLHGMNYHSVETESICESKFFLLFQLIHTIIKS
jgi:hypothetical protein